MPAISRAGYRQPPARRPMPLFGVANFYPRSAPDVRVGRNHMRRDFAVGDLCVPLVAYELDPIRNGEHELRDGSEVDECGERMSDQTGLALWPTSTLVVSVLMRCRGQLGSTDVLELGSGSGFCRCAMLRRRQQHLVSPAASQSKSLEPFSLGTCLEQRSRPGRVAQPHPDHLQLFHPISTQHYHHKYLEYVEVH